MKKNYIHGMQSNMKHIASKQCRDCLRVSRGHSVITLFGAENDNFICSRKQQNCASKMRPCNDCNRKEQRQTKEETLNTSKMTLEKNWISVVLRDCEI